MRNAGQDTTRGWAYDGWLFYTVLAAVLATFTGFALHAAHELPETVDENLYVQTARVALAEGHWDHPDMRFQGPFGLVFNQLLVGDLWTPETERHVSPELLFRSRLGMLGFGLASILGVAFWARRLFGERGGALAAAAFGLHPLVVGYGALVNVDMAHAATTLLCAWYTARFVEGGGWLDLLGAGFGLGLAVGTKYLALALAPFVGILVLVGAARRAPRQAGFAVPAAGALLVATTFVTLHAVYLFRSGLASGFEPASELFSRLFAVPGFAEFAGLLPREFLAGVDRLLAYDQDWSIFYLGEYVVNPKSYYLVVAALKTPPVMLGLAVLAAVVWGLRWRDLASEVRWHGAALLVLVLAPLAFLTFGSSFKVGIRYVLQLAPLCAVAFGVLGVVLDRVTARGLALVVALANVPVLATWAPNQIAYVNALGRRDGLVDPLLFGDSNAEWGQWRELGPTRLRERWGDALVALRGLDGPRFGTVAVYLFDRVRRDPEEPSRPWHWIAPFTPVDALDASWWVYEVTPEVYADAVRRTRDPRVAADFFAALVRAGRLDEARAALADVDEARRPLLERVLAFERGDAGVGVVELAGEALAAGQPEWALRVLEDAPDAPATTWIASRALLAQNRLDEAIELLAASAHLDEEPRLALTLAELLVRKWRIPEARALVDAHGAAMVATNEAWAAQVVAKLEKREVLLGLLRRE